MADEQELWIVTAQPQETVTGDKGNPWKSPQTAAAEVVKSVKVSAETLEANMSEFLDTVGGLFQRAERQTEMRLEEVELSVEIAADGEVKLVGTGVGVAGKGAITLKFKRLGAKD